MANSYQRYCVKSTILSFSSRCLELCYVLVSAVTQKIILRPIFINFIMIDSYSICHTLKWSKLFNFYALLLSTLITSTEFTFADWSSSAFSLSIYGFIIIHKSTLVRIGESFENILLSVSWRCWSFQFHLPMTDQTKLYTVLFNSSGMQHLLYKTSYLWFQRT